MDEKQVGNLTVRIEQDSDPMDPREWSNLGTMYCAHRRYKLGDEQVDPNEFNPRDYAIALPLYLYDHSGLRMKVGSFAGLLPQGHAEFDSGLVGYICVTAEKIRSEYSVKRISRKTLAKAAEVLASEVSTYDDYLSGNVWNYVVEDEEGNHIDSCCGFIGDSDYAMQQGVEAAEHALKFTTGDGERFHTLVAATDHANEVLADTGVVLAIEEGKR